MTAPTVTLPVGDAAAAAPEAKKSKKKLIIIIVAVLLVGGMGAKMTVLKKTTKPGPPVPGAVVTLDDATINLAGGHYLKLGMTLQLIKDKAAGDPPDGSAASDIANTYFTDRTVTAVISPAGRDAAKKAILRSIEAQQEYKGKVMDIYFPTYVTQ